MADEEQFIDDDVTGEEEAAAGARPGFVSGVLLTVLKWAAIGLGVVIVVATITWATVSLFFRGRTSTGLAEFSPEYQVKRTG